MRIFNWKQAQRLAKVETQRTKRRHIAVRTQYWSNGREAYIPCFTLVLLNKKG